MSDIVIDGGYPGGWLDTIVDFNFPSNFAVLTFDVEWAGDSQFSSAMTYQDNPIVSVVGQGGRVNTTILSSASAFLNKQPVIFPFPAFSYTDIFSYPTGDHYDYQKGTILTGSNKGFATGGGTYSGAHSQDLVDTMWGELIPALMSFYHWDRPTALSNAEWMFDYDFGILQGWYPPNQDPSLYDVTAEVTLVQGGSNNSLYDYHNTALLISLGPFKGTGSTVEIKVSLAGNFPHNTYSWSAGCATYKKALKGWNKNPPVGWNIGTATYPTYALYNWHRTQGYDQQLLGPPASSVDCQELDSAPFTQPSSPPRSITFSINNKTLAVTPSG